MMLRQACSTWRSALPGSDGVGLQQIHLVLVQVIKVGVVDSILCLHAQLDALHAAVHVASMLCCQMWHVMIEGIVSC